MGAEFDDLFDQQRASLEQTFAKKHHQLRATTEVFKQSLQNSKRQGWHTHAQLWNLGIYINLAAHDLSVLVWQLCVERDIWTRKLLARHVALLMYETTEDMTQLLGKRVREPLDKLGILPTFDGSLRTVREPLDQFWKQHAGKFNHIRRTSAAHRDLDGLTLFDTIDTIDIYEIIDRGLELGKVLNNIGSVVQSILTASSKIAPPELYKKHT